MTYNFNFLGMAINPSSTNINECLRTGKKEPYIKFSIAIDLGNSKGGGSRQNTGQSPELSSEKKTLWVNVLVFFKERQNNDGMMIQAEIPERFAKLQSQNIVYGRGKILNTKDNSITVVVEPRELVIYSLGGSSNNYSGRGSSGYSSEGGIEEHGVKFFDDLIEENKKKDDKDWF